MRDVAIVVTRNRRQLLEKCLTALMNQTQEDCDIWVIDNASGDGTAELVRSLNAAPRKLRYTNTGDNLGGAGGFSLGVRLAVETGYEGLWLMDDDVVPQKDALERLVEADRLLNGEYGFLSSVALWKDGAPCRMNRQKLAPHFFQSVGLLAYGLLPINQASFVSLFLRADTVLTVGLPVKAFFIWGDDVEYTRRISVHFDMPCYLCGKSVVTHMTNNNEGSNVATDARERIPRYHYAYRNEFFVYRKEGVRGILYYFAKCALHLFRIVVRGKGFRCKRAGALLRGMAEGLVFFPKIETIRNGSGEEARGFFPADPS